MLFIVLILSFVNFKPHIAKKTQIVTYLAFTLCLSTTHISTQVIAAALAAEISTSMYLHL